MNSSDIPEMKLDIGCGGKGTRWEGFIGIDLWPDPHNGRPYCRMDFVTAQLPWDADSADEIIALHVIEHMDRESGKTLVKRAYRLLKPKCKLTIACPNLRYLCKAYLEEPELLEERHLNNGPEIWPGATPADRLNWAIHQEGHMWSYDLNSLVQLATEAGIGEGHITSMPRTSPYCTRIHETGIEIIK